MQVVIEIDEEKYQNIMKVKNGIWGSQNMDSLEYAIANGTPLPKGHGALVEVNSVIVALVHNDFLKDTVTCGQIVNILDKATIIEADKENKDA